MCDGLTEPSTTWTTVLLGVLLLLGVVVGFTLGSIGLFRGEDAGGAGGNFVVDDRPVVLANDVDAEFLPRMSERCAEVKEEERERHTTMSSVLSSKGSDSTPSADRHSAFMKVPFDDLTSLMNIFLFSSQTSACCLERTFESK